MTCTSLISLHNCTTNPLMHYGLIYPIYKRGNNSMLAYVYMLYLVPILHAHSFIPHVVNILNV
jgi:hypothetical protein